MDDDEKQLFDKILEFLASKYQISMSITKDEAMIIESWQDKAWKYEDLG